MNFIRICLCINCGYYLKKARRSENKLKTFIIRNISQCSVLFFILNRADIPTKNDSMIFMFVDDTTIFRISKDRQTVNKLLNNLQIAINNIFRYNETLENQDQQ